MEDIIKLGKVFRELADICDEFSSLDEKEKNGEDVKKLTENIAGRFFIKITELEQLRR